MHKQKELPTTGFLLGVVKEVYWGHFQCSGSGHFSTLLLESKQKNYRYESKNLFKTTFCVFKLDLGNDGSILPSPRPMSSRALSLTHTTSLQPSCPIIGFGDFKDTSKTPGSTYQSITRFIWCIRAAEIICTGFQS